ncbi:hypothetical protein [Nocardia takedensis]|uniref:hypothetical protein n=1 Tax=Nocardia takedensis TaxID=259390 RepID=UPI0002FF286E|nr:hypothetical protein [Nocardia takedensis]
MNLWGITLGAGEIALTFLGLLAGFVVYVAAKVVAHLVSEEVEGNIDRLGYGLVYLVCLRLPPALRAEYYQWWRADLAEIFLRHHQRPITRLIWAVRFAVPLLFTGRKTARILHTEAFVPAAEHDRYQGAIRFLTFYSSSCAVLALAGVFFAAATPLGFLGYFMTATGSITALGGAIVVIRLRIFESRSREEGR